MTLAVPAALAFICFYQYRRKRLQAKHLMTTIGRECGLVLLVMSFAGILATTLWSGENAGVSEINIIPFRTIIEYAKVLCQGTDKFRIIVICFIGNVVVFMPLGFLPALLFEKVTWKTSLIIGGGASLLVEIMQYFVGRSSDIDDIILNTLGALCGYMLFIVLKISLPKVVGRFRCVIWES